MGGLRFWSRKKKSKAEKGNQRKKSSTGNVKGNPSGTSSAPDHLRASNGSCLDVCTCKKGHFSPVNAWNTTLERTSSPYDTQKDIRFESPFEKLKNSTVQLKPSLNVRTNSSQQEIKSSTPAMKNKLSAVKLKPSLDLNRSLEPPGSIKSEIPLLSKKFQVINRYPSPSDIRIFKYNESVISSPNSSPGSTRRLVVGSPFSSPTSLTSLNGTKKTSSQSRDIMGTTKTSIEKTDSSPIEPIKSGSVSLFDRKFSSWGFFSAVRKHKKGKADQKKKYLNEKDQLLVKTSDHNQISPLSCLDEKLTHDKDQTKILYMVDVASRNEILGTVQTNGHGHISSSTSPLFPFGVTLAQDGDKVISSNINDTAIENDILEPFQTDCSSKVTSSASPLSRSFMTLTHDDYRATNLHMNDATTMNIMLESMQTNDHSQISPSSKSIMELTFGKHQETNLEVDDVSTRDEVLEPLQTHNCIQISTSSSPLSRSDGKLTHDNDEPNIFHIVDMASNNEMLEHVQTNGHIHNSTFTSPLSPQRVTLTHDNERAQEEVTFAHDHDQTKILHDDMTSENKILEPIQSDSQNKISSPTFPSWSSMTFTHDNNETKHLHVNDATTDNEMLELMKTDSHDHISSSTTCLSQHVVVPNHDNGVSTENEILEPVQIEGHSQIFISTSPMSQMARQLTHDNDQVKILHVATENEMLELVQTHDHSQISPHTSPLSQSSLKLTQDNDQVKILHVVDTTTTNDMLEPDGNIHISASISPLSMSTVKFNHEDEQKKILYKVQRLENQLLEPGQTGGHIQISNSNELVEPECTDVENEELCEDIDIIDLEDFEYIYSYDSEDSEYAEDIDEINLENVDVININKVDTSIGMHHINPKKGKQYTTEDKDDPFYKCKFRRDKIVDLQSDNDVPGKLKFMRGKVVENHNGTRTYVEMRRLRKREIIDNTNATSPNSIYSNGYDSEDSVYADGEMDGFKTESSDVVNISKVDTLKDKHHRNPRNNKQFPSEEDHLVVKRKFRRGRVVDLQSENEVPKILKFRRRRVVEDDDGTKTYVRRRRYKKREFFVDTNATCPNSEKVVLRHQELQEKKDELCLFNDVIEERVTVLSKSRKSKVKTLVGAFETVISLQDDRTPRGELTRSPLFTSQSPLFTP